jgi:hypothetical protein
MRTPSPPSVAPRRVVALWAASLAWKAAAIALVLLLLARYVRGI